MNAPDFWLNPESAGKISKTASDLAKEIDAWEHLRGDISAALEIAREDAAQRDVTLLEELKEDSARLEKELVTMEFTLFFDGPYDHRNAIVTIYAGSGGTEAMDWAQMLERMIVKFVGRLGYDARTIGRTPGDIAGIKNTTIEVSGPTAYGWLKGEHGVHRLVRISPFDAEQMRHTSFAMIEVLPEFEEIDAIAVDPKDLRIDTFLSSGHGGQSVQTTYSAVRIVHNPTGITVSCQNERSQLQNKETAMKILTARLLQRRRQEQQQERSEVRGELVSAEWGNQIRSYVLQPYKLVKDHRTGHESRKPDEVLEGDVMAFEESYLRWRKKSHSTNPSESRPNKTE